MIYTIFNHIQNNYLMKLFVQKTIFQRNHGEGWSKRR